MTPRIETLCEPLGRSVLLSAELAAAVEPDHRLAIYALESGRVRALDTALTANTRRLTLRRQVSGFHSAGPKLVINSTKNTGGRSWQMTDWSTISASFKDLGISRIRLFT
jgi:hypothetical protein